MGAPRTAELSASRVRPACHAASTHPSSPASRAPRELFSYVRWRTLLGAFTAGRSGDLYGSRDMLRVVGSPYFISELGSALAWQLFVRRISILRRRRHRRIFNARSAVPHADRTGASTRYVRRIVPTLNFVTGILAADGSNFFRSASESAVILAYFSGIFQRGVRARSRGRRRGTLDFESADRRRLSGDRRAFESRTIHILAR
jgi:hypothetical protein